MSSTFTKVHLHKNKDLSPTFSSLHKIHDLYLTVDSLLQTVKVTGLIQDEKHQTRPTLVEGFGFRSGGSVPQLLWICLFIDLKQT